MDDLAHRIREVARRGRRFDDRGAALVEFALMSPFLVLLCIGLLEFGFAWRQNLYVERSAQVAGRTGASSGTDPFTDYDIIQSVASTMSGAERADLVKVIVYDAGNSSALTSCRALSATGTAAKGISGVCNVYSPAQVFTSSPGVGFARTTNATTCGSGWDQRWCPMSQRDRTLPGATRLGVYVEANYDPLTGIIPGTTQRMSSTAVFQLEPTYFGRD